MAVPLPSGLVIGNSYVAYDAGFNENKSEETDKRKESLLLVERKDPTENAFLPKLLTLKTSFTS